MFRGKEPKEFDVGYFSLLEEGLREVLGNGLVINSNIIVLQRITT